MDKKTPRRGRMHYGAGYKLHREVKHPTPALLRASQIGVLVHDEPSMADKEDRDALLVVPYGVSRQEARQKTLEPLLDAIAEENPEADLYEAYTSKIMREGARKRAGLEIPSLEEALEALLASGYTRVAIASMHLFPGAEYEAMTETFNAYRSRFKRLVLGTPLLYWMGQEEQRDDASELSEALRQLFPPGEAEDAVLFMAHGTSHPSNSFFTLLQERMDAAEWKNAFVYTMEGWPRLEHILPRLKERGIRRVTLVPLVLAAGVHVLRDMAGDASDSHRAQLEAEGFSVEAVMKGMGEFPSLRALYVNRANEAWDRLQEN